MLDRPHHILPHPMPESPNGRLLLFAVRRMAAHGLDDAHAAHAFLTAFGMGFRRPLVLLRAFMAEASRVSATRLLVAPHCCARMTRVEHGLLTAIGTAADDPAGAHERLCGLLHIHSCLGLLTSAQAVAAGFADLGLPIEY